MAKKSVEIKQPLSVACSICGKTIPNADKLPFPCNAVWREGRWICWDCLCGKTEFCIK